MKFQSAIAAMLFLSSLAVWGCSTLNPPKTAEEEEQYIQLEDERFPDPMSIETGDE